MTQGTRFPLVWSIFTAACGVVSIAALSLQLFFSLTDYGFFYSDALLWVGLVSTVCSLICLTVWLHRRAIRRVFPKILTLAACILLSLTCVATVFIVMFGSTMGGVTLTRAGSISGNRHYVHTSPNGTNRFVIMFGAMDEELIHAYPMLNRWIYKEVDNGFVWEAHVQPKDYMVEWPSETLAVIEVLKYSEQVVEGENPDSKIFVTFDK